MPNNKCDYKIIDDFEKQLQLDIVGNWTQGYINNITEELFLILSKVKNKNVTFNFKNSSNFDSAGMIMITEYIQLLITNNCSVVFVNMSSKQKALLLFYRKNKVINKINDDASKNIFYNIGKFSTNYLSSFILFLSFLGELFYYFFYTLLHPSKIRFKAIITQIDLSGIKAIPIVVLTSFLIGLVMAYQGAGQLRQFGANIFIVEMISISMIRELAPLITAIVIAGRSASSFTAQIGTMKITEEIDAMKTMAFEPAIFLVMPRVIALMISLPLIVFLADIVGILGGMFVANSQLDISYTVFIERLYSEVELRHFLIGILKAPIFGFIIAIIGCYRGFQVTGSTDSIGKYTTISVVDAIFWVIALNALFSIIFTQLGI